MAWSIGDRSRFENHGRRNQAPARASNHAVVTLTTPTELGNPEFLNSESPAHLPGSHSPAAATSMRLARATAHEPG